jgi:Trk K+ transport system NAD-binding subunit
MAEAAVLVCGLGALGQACLQRLVRFNVPIRCLDRQQPNWRDPRLEAELAHQLTLGDMRLPHVLRRAGAETACAVLLLSSESTVNIEAALQVRLINPTTEIVVRSSSRQSNLGALLEDRLPGVAVVDPVLLCAGAIASALRPDSIPASFEAHGQTFQITEQSWGDQRLQRPLKAPPSQAGDPPLLVSPHSLRSRSSESAHRTWRPQHWWARWSQGSRQIPWLGRQSRPQQLAIAAVVGMAAVGIQRFSNLGGWEQGVFVTLALLKGEYVDPVNLLLAQDSGVQAASAWLIGGTLFYSLVGTLLTSALVAVILERLLRDRLGQAKPSLPRRGGPPILLVEGGALAGRVARLLQRESSTVLTVAPRGERTDPGIRFDDLSSVLHALHDRPVRAVGLLSSDLLANLQSALSFQQRWPEARIAMLAHAFGAAEQLGDLLGGVAVISAVDLVADAMVATAFGERIEAVLRLKGTNLLQVRYRIKVDDTLCGRSISRLQNGYGITVVSLLRPTQGSTIPLPKLDTVVTAGDQLIVLATADSLRRIELGDATPADCRLRLQFPGESNPSRRFAAQQSLARWLGCAPGDVAALLDGREQLTPPLDGDLCGPLIEELHRQGVRCSQESA